MKHRARNFEEKETKKEEKENGGIMKNRMTPYIKETNKNARKTERKNERKKKRGVKRKGTNKEKERKKNNEKGRI